MTTSKKISLQELSELIDVHLGEFLEKEANWEVLDSPISGRGIFARRYISVGEIIFREHALLVGPTANSSCKLNTCCVCYCCLEGNDQQMMCKNGCTMPICSSCCTSEKHLIECLEFRKWQPKDNLKINRHSMRIISINRSIFLNDLQLKLLYALQANPDKYYMLEIQKAAKCFELFPAEKISSFYRITCAVNTNAFESKSCVQGHEVLLRALFPVAGLMNHQCTPNANHHFEDGETIVVTAARAIAQGEEIVTSYTKLLWSTLARQVFLAMTKKFTCACARCLDPTVSGNNSAFGLIRFIGLCFVLFNHLLKYVCI